MNELNVKKLENFTWTDVTNPTLDFLNEMNESHQFDFHLIEDTLQEGHLPKFERIGEWNFIIFRAHSPSPKRNIITVNDLTDKIAFLFNEKDLLTIHTSEFDFLNDDKYETSNIENTVLLILDKMLKTYFEPIQVQSSAMDKFEEEIFLKKAKSISLEDLYFQRSKARISKKIILIFQAMLVHFEVKQMNRAKYNDIKDTVENHILMYDEILEDANMLLNSHLAIKAQKSNDIMTLLAIFSAFFLPLTFIAGIYGMNFINMPEIHTEYGYFVTIGVMVTISLITYRWFKRKDIL